MFEPDYNDENVDLQLSKNKLTAKKSDKGKTIEETYTKKTQLEHILLRPDTYVGSVEKQIQPMWVFDSELKQVVQKTVSFVPGLYKIFDEIIVNAADNKQRDESMDRIEVTINPEENSIRVWNNGNGIPVVIHGEHKIYVPELIFGNLLTGSNFDDKEEKTTGGRNGFGAKLANIFSTKFIVETVDGSRGLKFKQTFQNNMSTVNKPEIVKNSGSDYTCITFFPDLARFKMDSMDEDIVSLLSKRVYDIAATNTASGSKKSKLNVYLNGSRIETKTFEQYIGIYDGLESPLAFERINDRWEIGVGVSDGTFQQVSYVNSICTIKGGCHVNYIADQITARLVAAVKKKNKGTEVKPGQIKNHLALYVNCLIVNPAFDSQTKETLTTKHASFGSTCVVPEKFFKILEKSSLIDNILSWAKFKQNAELKKKGGTKKSKIFGVAKLDDANFAGTSKSKDCTLILTEGDSAKSLAISGLGIVGRDLYGVFPLKGKLLNVREAAHSQIMKNDEIQNVAKILGLTFGRIYEDTSSLRYGHLMIMADQDHDGSHIKGLLINFIHHFWPSLLKIDGFMQQFITPIVKCTKGNQKPITFFTIPEYINWKEDNNDGKGWKIKYYKGLGTSTSAEAKEYFSHLETHEVHFKWDETADNFIDLAFSKKRADDRKQWLLALKPGCHIDYDVETVSYNDFINNELILFSHADNERSIPHFMDGFKPSQRKVLYSCFKRNLKQEIKVAQLAGYISEHTAYHHGEVSLTMTIISMAQSFVGSNNINLLTPCGQFGTRLMGGKDAASPRYVFTKLENITRCIFHPDDDPILNYLEDDGQTIEPFCYVPVIPMILVNGSDGIGTGWSTNVPTYNPREIIENLRLMIAGEEPNPMIPWYRGFTGEIRSKSGKDSMNFTVSGVMDQVDDCTLRITELPIGCWTAAYKTNLESMLVGSVTAKEDGVAPEKEFKVIKELRENHTDTKVLFTLGVASEVLDEHSHDMGSLYKKFKLEGSIATTNMTMFDMNSRIIKFDSPLDIMREFFAVRIDYYDKRKCHLIEKLTGEWEKLDNKVSFIKAAISGKLIISNRKKAELLQELKKTGFKLFIENKLVSKAGDGEVEEDDEDNDANSSSLDKGYDYLLGMKIWSLTAEKITDLTAQRDHKKSELDTLMSKTPEDLYLDDLDNLEIALGKFEDEIKAANDEDSKTMKKNNSKKSSTTSICRIAPPAIKVVHVKSTSTVRTKLNQSNDLDDDDDDNDNEMEVIEKVVKPVTVKKTVVTKNVIPAPKKVALVKEKDDAPLSLRERLALKNGAKLSEPISTSIKQLSKKTIDLSIESDEEDVPLSVAIPIRKKTVKKSTYLEDSDEEDEFEDDASEIYESEASDSDFEEEIKPVKKLAPKQSKNAAPSKGVKRSQKKNVAESPPAKNNNVKEIYSPEIYSPALEKKKQRKEVAKKEGAKKPVAKAKDVAVKKQPVSRKKIIESEDESEEEFSASDEEIISRSPKPVRTRKAAINVAAYFNDDDDEEEEDEDLDDSDEEY